MLILRAISNALEEAVEPCERRVHGGIMRAGDENAIVAAQSQLKRARIFAIVRVKSFKRRLRQAERARKDVELILPFVGVFGVDVRNPRPARREQSKEQCATIESAATFI